MTQTQPEEIVWIVDEENRPLGGTVRSIMRRKRLIHRSTYILVLDPRDRLLVQKRTMSKDVYPGLWEICAGGVVAYGEDYFTSASRELQEETGISGVPLTRITDFYFEDEHNRVWGRLFSCRWDGDIVPQEEEVEQTLLADRKTLSRLLSEERFTPDSHLVMNLVREMGISPFDRLFSP